MLCAILRSSFFFFFNDTATTEIYTLSLHDALPISGRRRRADRAALRHGRRIRLQRRSPARGRGSPRPGRARSEEHTSELQSRLHLVCRLLLEKKKKNRRINQVDKQRQLDISLHVLL